MNLLLMANDRVGVAIAEWLIQEYRDDLVLVVSTSENEIFDLAGESGIRRLVASSSEQIYNYITEASVVSDLGLLAWWPSIIKDPLLSCPKHGFINTHPSFLPYNRGKHYSFWCLVEQAPFGVSLHFVDAGIDSGDIVAQERIAYGWEDNGATLYSKAATAMVALFKESYPSIRTLNIPRRKQDPMSGSFHLGNEIRPASQIDLQMTYTARDLLNLLRARTFPGRPACWFREDDGEYNIQVEITKKQ